MKKYSLKQDHANIKRQVKSWELICDELVHRLNDKENLTDYQIDRMRAYLEEMNHEMMTINL